MSTLGLPHFHAFQPTWAVPCATEGPVVETSGWRIQQRLHTGRYCRLFLARPDRPDAANTDYVIKILRPDFQDDPDLARMFRQEAWVGMHVSHPNLVPVLNCQTADGPKYLIMPYLAGASLSQVMDEARRFSIPQAVWITRQVADALNALHDAGWVHGDIKPSNIQVDLDGHATLVDLGHTAPAHPSGGGMSAPFAATLEYAAPELFSRTGWRGPSTDLYALGATLFELIAGRRPFVANSPSALVQAHREAPVPDLAALRPDAPANLAELVRQLLAKEPLRRPGSAAEVSARLVELELETLALRFGE